MTNFNGGPKSAENGYKDIGIPPISTNYEIFRYSVSAQLRPIVDHAVKYAGRGSKEAYLDASRFIESAVEFGIRGETPVNSETPTEEDKNIVLNRIFIDFVRSLGLDFYNDKHQYKTGYKYQKSEEEVLINIKARKDFLTDLDDYLNVFKDMSDFELRTGLVAIAQDAFSGLIAAEFYSHDNMLAMEEGRERHMTADYRRKMDFITRHLTTTVNGMLNGAISEYKLIDALKRLGHTDAETGSPSADLAKVDVILPVVKSSKATVYMPIQVKSALGNEQQPVSVRYVDTDDLKGLMIVEFSSSYDRRENIFHLPDTEIGIIGDELEHYQDFFPRFVVEHPEVVAA